MEKETFKRFHFIFEEALKSEEDENAELPPGHGNLYTLFSVTVVFKIYKLIPTCKNVLFQIHKDKLPDLPTTGDEWQIPSAQPSK